MRAAAVALALAAAPAAAQTSVEGSVAVASDERRRGISWSDGAVAPAAAVTLRAGGFDLGASAVTTRRDPRHGGADAAIDVTGGYSADVGGGVRLDAFVAGHLFAGARGGLDYLEGGAGASYLIGPVEAGVEARYAPPQDAIGGDNLYLGVRAVLGVPATPYTITATAGRSSGKVDDPLRAERLRPGGRYHDWSLGADRITGPLTIGVRYTGTDIGRRDGLGPFANARHAGDKLTARVAFSF